MASFGVAAAMRSGVQYAAMSAAVWATPPTTRGVPLTELAGLVATGLLPGPVCCEPAGAVATLTIAIAAMISTGVARMPVQTAPLGESFLFFTLNLPGNDPDRKST